MSVPALPVIDALTPLAGIRDFAWLGQQSFPPLQWAVPQILPEGLALLIGAPKLGKSWLSLDIALAIAAGGTTLGSVQVGDPRRVLMLALEDSDRRLQDRARTLLGDAPWPRNLQYVTRLPPNVSAFELIAAWLYEGDPACSPPVVILDTLGKVMPASAAGESAYQRDYRIAGGLKRLADDTPGCTLLALHHDRKANADDFVEAVSGTNGIAGAADSILVLGRSRNSDTGVLKVTGRDVIEAEFQLSLNGGRWQFAGGGPGAAAEQARRARTADRFSDRTGEILKLAEAHPEGIRAAHVANALGLESHQANTYLRRLNDRGHLVKPKRGLYKLPGVLDVLDVLDCEGEPETTLPTLPTLTLRGVKTNEHG